ncbi:S-adenosyl-L-methionine-dependent methyltransferase [Glomus cerebriforme]|uniref:S-adenosyl-L-methionine-dependent methyltransferase n=1 Tax=Glomus cerebriforme TaxID=658196 RepID=A0A397SDH5_9GLOM|nr:S-adenosyl-L-methionine-dependent methyltransferase [Glomus cerebriforme]
MGNALRKNGNAVRDEHNGRRRRRIPVQDPPTTPTKYGTKYILAGRSRNGGIKYPLPVNVEEKNMWLEDQHYFIRHLWQSNFSSPVGEILKTGGANVLDIGCGNGTWLLEMAKDFPESKFVGVDIAPLFPTNHGLENLEFRLNNLLEGLPFEDNTFDLVFARLVGDTFSEREWEETVLRELGRLIKPGGFLEIMQTDSELFSVGKNSEIWNKALLAMNMNNSICEKFENWLLKLLKEKQFSNISHEVVISPIGTWANKTGEFGVAYIRHLSSQMKPQIINQLNINETEYDRLVEMMEQEYNEFSTYRKSHRFIAQKNY